MGQNVSAENVKRASAPNGSSAPEKVEHNACALATSSITLTGPGLAGKKKESGFNMMYDYVSVSTFIILTLYKDLVQICREKSAFLNKCTRKPSVTGQRCCRRAGPPPHFSETYLSSRSSSAASAFQRRRRNPPRRYFRGELGRCLGSEDPFLR